MSPVLGAGIRPAGCGHYVPVGPGRPPRRCRSCRSAARPLVAQPNEQWEWSCRQRGCRAGGVCATGLLAFAEEEWHRMITHPEKVEA